MSFLLGGDQPTNQAQDYTGIPIQTSVSTLPIPLGWGTFMLAPNLIDYLDFTRTEVDAGGKGGGGKAGATNDYKATLVMALGEGGIDSIDRVYVNQGFEGLADLGMTLLNGGDLQAPWSTLAAKHPDHALAYHGTALIVVENYDLGATPALPNHNFQCRRVAGFEAAWATGVFHAADLALVIQDALTNARYGVPGWRTAAIVLATLLSGADAATTGDAALQTYLQAIGLAFHPVLSSQEQFSSALARWLQLANCAVVWSGTALKFVPRGDQPVTGNGVTYLPNLTPSYDLTEDDFVGDASADAVTGSITDPTDTANVVRLEVTTNDGYFSFVPVEVRDQRDIDAVGREVIGDTVTAHEIVGAYMGRLAAQLILQRGLYVRNSYAFKLGVEFSLLEPTDIVTLTEPALGLFRAPVRLTSVEEDDQGVLSIVAEELPDAIATATPSAAAAPVFSVPDAGVAAVPVSDWLIFEPSSQLVDRPQIWIGASAASGGAADPSFGGAQVWVSLDNASYRHLGDLAGAARMGTLTGALAAPIGGNPDLTSALAVDLSESGGELISGTDLAASLGQTLCYVDGELLAFATATLTGANRYSLTRLQRGLYGTMATAHAAGTKFVRLDDAIAKFDLPAAFVGKTLWVKLLSFNLFGRTIAPLSAVTAIPYAVAGTAYGFASNDFMAILLGGGAVSLGNLADPISSTFSCGQLAQGAAWSVGDLSGTVTEGWSRGSLAAAGTGYSPGDLSLFTNQPLDVLVLGEL